MVYAKVAEVLNDAGDKQKRTTGFSKVRTIAVTSGKGGVGKVKHCGKFSNDFSKV